MAENGASQATSSSAAGQDGLDGNSNAQGTEAVGSGPKTSVTLNAPNPAVTYGRLNPEIEENVAIVETVSDEGLRGNAADRYNMLSSRGNTPLSVDPASNSSRGTVIHAVAAPSTNYPSSVNLPSLPSELIASIFSYLSPIELAAVSLVCQSLRSHALADIQWQRHVLSNLPGNQITSPYPCKTWRELYIAHDPHWFLTKHKLWFADRGLTGQMVIARYDERRGCIEGYQLVATRRRDGSEPWLADQTVHIHYFEPHVKLHLDKPILKFDVDSLDKGGDGSLPGARPFFAERPMHYNRGTDPRLSNFLLAKPLDDLSLTTHMLPAFPYGHVWPPPTIPARHRVLGRSHTIDGFPEVPPEAWEPAKRSDMSDQTFRIRLWMEMGLPTLGVHINEEFVTYSTLDPSLYTPTPEKPWRGIWVGDYSGHGCEFLLMNQPNSLREDQQEPLARFDNETEEQFQARFQNERVYRGRLEAIKLTGDPNVARGEYTFVADDLGDDGFVGIAEDPPFQGARVVKSRGHIASTGFIDGKIHPPPSGSPLYQVEMIEDIGS
ncbi:F-box domain-containing protein [Biscogniauxia mediterranea]|nr:F-box domain-containing protein [Biscogniauxia mediterranea]